MDFLLNVINARVIAENGSAWKQLFVGINVSKGAIKVTIWDCLFQYAPIYQDVETSDKL